MASKDAKDCKAFVPGRWIKGKCRTCSRTKSSHSRTAAEKPESGDDSSTALKDSTVRAARKGKKTTSKATGERVDVGELKVLQLGTLDLKDSIEILRKSLEPGGPCLNLDFDPWGARRDISTEEYAIIRDLLIQNKVYTLKVGSGDRVPFQGDFKNLQPLCEGIMATSALVHLTWARCTHTGGDLAPISLLVPAMELNRSILSFGNYILNYPVNGIPDEDSEECRADPFAKKEYAAVARIRDILIRNRRVQDMNASVAAEVPGAAWTSGCPLPLVRQVLAGTLKVHGGFLDPKGDRCFCRHCMKERQDEEVYERGTPPRPYLLPVGWCRVGLKVSEGIVGLHDPFKKWHNSFHATDITGMGHIFRSDLRLLKAGDVALGGGVLGVKAGHIPKCFTRLNKHTNKKELFDPNQIFTSPSMRYSSHPAYAVPHVIDHPTIKGKRLVIKVSFQLRQRPDSYAIGQETVGAKCQLDPHISNNELEYYTRESVGLLVHGLLVQLAVL